MNQSETSNAKVVADAPHDVMLVLDGSRSECFEQAKQFTAATEVSCLAVTKLDGTCQRWRCDWDLRSISNQLNTLVLVKELRIFRCLISMNL
jgi:hypothetical protein